MSGGGDRAPHTADETLAAALSRDVGRLVAAEPAVRSDTPDAVHQMRVAARRLRSVLSAYRPLLRHAETDALRDELRWLAGILGSARDAEVRAERLRAGLAALPDEQVRGPVELRLVDAQRTDYAAAHAAAVAQLNGSRYRELRAELEALAAVPPLRGRARKPGRKVVKRLLGKERRRVDRMAAAAETADDRERALHDVRKAAKQLRYAAEVARPALGKDAERLASAAKQVQTVLGDYRDALASRTLVRAAATTARRRGEDPFTYRLLAKSEAAQANRTLRDYPPALAALRDI